MLFVHWFEHIQVRLIFLWKKNSLHATMHHFEYTPFSQYGQFRRCVWSLFCSHCVRLFIKIIQYKFTRDSNVMSRLENAYYSHYSFLYRKVKAFLYYLKHYIRIYNDCEETSDVHEKKRRNKKRNNCSPSVFSCVDGTLLLRPPSLHCICSFIVLHRWFVVIVIVIKLHMGSREINVLQLHVFL